MAFARRVGSVALDEGGGLTLFEPGFGGGWASGVGSSSTPSGSGSLLVKCEAMEEMDVARLYSLWEKLRMMWIDNFE